MWLRLLISWLVLALLTGVAGANGNEAVRLQRLERANTIKLHDLQRYMTLGDMSVAVIWKECNEFNAFYDPSTLRVTLCLELMDLDPLKVEPITRFIFAHEMAHAIIHQRDIPFTGSEEVAADELAALTMLALGEPEAVVTMAQIWRQDSNDLNPMDQHLHGKQRGFNLLCLWAGSEGDFLFNCGEKYKTAIHNWSRLLNYAKLD